MGCLKVILYWRLLVSLVLGCGTCSTNSISKFFKSFFLALVFPLFLEQCCCYDHCLAAHVSLKWRSLFFTIKWTYGKVKIIVINLNKGLHMVTYNVSCLPVCWACCSRRMGKNKLNEHIKTNLCKYSIIDFLSIIIANEVEDGCTFL